MASPPPAKVLDTLAHLACTEAGVNYPEVRAVLSVVLNRARNWNKSLYRIATARNQFFLNGCRDPSNRWRRVTSRHRRYAQQTYNRTLTRPSWMGPRVMWFATEKALRKVRRKKGRTYTFYDVWIRRGWVPVKKTLVKHIYWKDKK